MITTKNWENLTSHFDGLVATKENTFKCISEGDLVVPLNDAPNLRAGEEYKVVCTGAGSFVYVAGDDNKPAMLKPAQVRYAIRGEDVIWGS